MVPVCFSCYTQLLQWAKPRRAVSSQIQLQRHTPWSLHCAFSPCELSLSQSDFRSEKQVQTPVRAQCLNKALGWQIYWRNVRAVEGTVCWSLTNEVRSLRLHFLTCLPLCLTWSSQESSAKPVSSGLLRNISLDLHSDLTLGCCGNGLIYRISVIPRQKAQMVLTLVHL